MRTACSEKITDNYVHTCSSKDNLSSKRKPKQASHTYCAYVFVYTYISESIFSPVFCCKLLNTASKRKIPLEISLKAGFP
jgi:hypothetical protein